MQTAEGRAEATAFFAPKRKEATLYPADNEEPLPNQQPRVIKTEPPPSAAPASGPVRRSSRHHKPAMKLEEAEEDGRGSSAAPAPPISPVAAAAVSAQPRSAVKRGEKERTILPLEPLELPPLPPLPFVGSLGTAQPPAGPSGDGTHAPRLGATGSGSIAQAGLRVNASPPPGCGRMSPVEASQLWALRSPRACLQSPPILTDEMLALFDLEDEGGAEVGGGGGHTAGLA